MKKLLLLFIFLACGSAPIKIYEGNNQVFFDFNDRLKLFWEKAEYEDYSTKFKLWDKYVEGQYSEIYDLLIWDSGKSKRIARQVFKEITLFMNMNLYDAYIHRILDNKKNYVSQLRSQMKLFKTFYPDAQFKTAFYIMPLGVISQLGLAATLNADGKEYYRARGHDINSALILNTDLLSSNKQRANRAILHELFHIYTFEKQRQVRDFNSNKNSLIYSLFYEGLAEVGIATISKDAHVSLFIPEVKLVIKDSMKTLKRKFKENGVKMTPKKMSGFKMRCIQKYNLKHKVNFKCSDIYSYGRQFVEQLKKKKTIQEILKYDFETVKRKMIQFLKKDSNTVKKNFLLHIQSEG